MPDKEDQIQTSGNSATADGSEIIDGKGAGRRSFLKKAAFGGLAVATTAGLAEKIVSVSSDVDVRDAYMKDMMAFDKTWKGRKYVQMTDAEKEEAVAFFVKNYRQEAI